MGPINLVLFLVSNGTYQFGLISVFWGTIKLVIFPVSWALSNWSYFWFLGTYQIDLKIGACVLIRLTKISVLNRDIGRSRVLSFYGSFCLLVTTCHLLLTFANSLVQDQARQNVRFGLDPNCLSDVLVKYFRKRSF